jgi:hypothetical protein
MHLLKPCLLVKGTKQLNVIHDPACLTLNFTPLASEDKFVLSIEISFYYLCITCLLTFSHQEDQMQVIFKQLRWLMVRVKSVDEILAGSWSPVCWSYNPEDISKQ